MTIRHHVSQEFGIPRGEILKPIPGDLLEIIGGFSDDAKSMSPADLALALVIVEGHSYGNQRSWSFAARSAHPGDEDEPIFGSVDIEDDAGFPIAPRQALHEGEKWIRSSNTTEFVPGAALPLSIPEEMRTSAVAGLLLVRASEVNQ